MLDTFIANAPVADLRAVTRTLLTTESVPLVSSSVSCLLPTAPA